MTVWDSAERHRERLLALVDDGSDPSQLLAGLERLSREHEIDAGAALLLAMTGLVFDEPRARRHWDAIVDDLHELRAGLRRPVGIRTAVLDYFVNIHPRLDAPSLVGASAAPLEPGAEPWAGAGGFREQVDHEVRRARRYGGAVGLVLADLDGLARVNEQAGVAAGDLVLAAVAERLRSVAREHDTVARPGEDEFAWLLPGADRAETRALAERFRVAVAAPLDAGSGQLLRVRLSAGAAVFPGDAPAADVLLERAAQALYESKALGGDVVTAWRPERRRHMRREGAVGWVARVERAGGAEGGAVLLRDVSREGVAFFSETPFDVGSTVEVRLGSTAEASVARRGTVVHNVMALDEPARATTGAERDERAGRGAIAGYRVGVAFDPVLRSRLRPAAPGRDG